MMEKVWRDGEMKEEEKCLDGMKEKQGWTEETKRKGEMRER